MFTFGRDHEKACAVKYVRDKSQVTLIEDVIDAIHDLLESRMTEDALRPILDRAFTQGGAGVWEQTGSWLGRLILEHPQIQSMWTDFAKHTQWKGRFRTACFITEMPPIVAREVGAMLETTTAPEFERWRYHGLTN